jgi:predicted ribosome quality control (RQC) complex YloA/Tae2 family protein
VAAAAVVIATVVAGAAPRAGETRTTEPKPRVRAPDAGFRTSGLRGRAAADKEMSSKGRPYRTVIIEGFEVLIGRGDAENDELTFRVAERRDLWLHVAGGTPGSHVVIRSPEQGEVPKAVIEKAAQLAAWYSKARAAKRVEVHVCRVADVHKPRGAPLGLVEIERFKSLRVAPDKLT